jgi:hypothetical protein
VLTKVGVNMLAHAKSMNAGYGTNHLTHFDPNDPSNKKRKQAPVGIIGI